MSLYRVIDAHTNGVQTGNSAATNATALQALIDANTANGAVIWFCEPVPMNPITLKSNVFLQGNNVAAFKGSTPNAGASPSSSASPSGAAFLITNTSTTLITMQSNTGVDGFVFHYPSQVFSATTVAATTTYPYTITTVVPCEGISVTRCCFVGATKCISAPGTSIATNFVADIVVDLCYAYPLGGPFVSIAFAADIPRITRCHVNPGVGFQFYGDGGDGINCPIKTALITDMYSHGGHCFEFTTVDAIMVSECFAYGVEEAFYFSDCYGEMDNCAVDNSKRGAHVSGVTVYKSMAIDGLNLITNIVDAVVFDGTASNLKISNMHAVSSSGNSSVKVAGTGVQRLYLSNCTQTANGSAWANSIDNSNGSSVVVGSVTSY